jgi:hypothetical protein
LDRGIQGPLIGAATTILTATVGACLVVWQIGRQAENAISQTRKTELIKLKVKLYEEIIETTEQAVNANVRFTGLLRLIKDELSTASRQRKSGVAQQRPRSEFLKVLEADREVSNLSIGIMTIVERWLIIDPRLDVFRSAMSAAFYDVRETLNGRLVPTLVPILPVNDPASGGPFPYQLPSDETIGAIHDLCDELIENLSDVQSYVIDFQTEMQNLLLSDLFEHRVPTRQPLDPSLIAISLDRHKEIEEHLRTKTAWGRHRMRLEAETKARFADSAPDDVEK